MRSVIIPPCKLCQERLNLVVVELDYDGVYINCTFCNYIWLESWQIEPANKES